MEEFNVCSTEAAKKQFLGNYLYQFVTRYIQEMNLDQQPETKAGKVTGMILDG
jgi:hypothetical protein